MEHQDIVIKCSKGNCIYNAEERCTRVYIELDENAVCFTEYSEE